MRFWDTSAIVPLILAQGATEGMTAAYERDPELVVWWATEVECVSAVARSEREGAATVADVAAGLARLDALAAAWHEIQPASSIRRVATRLLRVHPLRAADAFQLAAAMTASEGEPRAMPFVTLDDRLAHAAEREGFPVTRPASG
jgi:predicted nucleic acid-binding protein